MARSEIRTESLAEEGLISERDEGDGSEDGEDGDDDDEFDQGKTNPSTILPSAMLPSATLRASRASRADREGEVVFLERVHM